MPVIRVELSAGRTQQQKQQVAEEITQSMIARCGCRPETIHIVFVDVKPSDWAVGGKFLGAPKT
jgi:4-oxalocrotonate tautomerase